MTAAISDEEIEKHTNTLRNFAKSTGYTLNPDDAFLRIIVIGLLENKKRFGYASCPCRIADGQLEKDKDIICPCVYRDPDLVEYGRCLCGLYVNEDYISGKKGREPIPDRRKTHKMSR
ncbi:MAG TPA: hypothetical protein ENN25_04120 [Euryarchaeota archaeon]|nr:hypothetical protein [Euryarchaeota archaeon]